LILSLLGEKNIGGDITISFKNLKLKKEELLQQAGVAPGASLSKDDQLKSRFVNDVAQAIESAPKVDVSAQIFGSWADPSLRITSNLTSLLSDVIKKSVGNLVQDQRKELEAKLDQIIKDKTGDIQAKVGPLEEKLNGQFGGIEKKIQEKVSEASGINLSPAGGGSSPLPDLKVPNLKKLFKK
jgi:hypothetical protein